MKVNEQKSFSENYAKAGVDITAGYKAVELMKEHVRQTWTPAVIDGIGGFGGLFKAPRALSYEEHVLVAGTDGVGTKLKIAMLMDKHDTVGIDCVAMCVNDIICCGAKPLFFLDYIACGKNHPEKIASIVKGITDGCVRAGCALIGGETAEHPGMMKEHDYDIAGFAVGIVDRKEILKPETQKPGDVLIALPSSGVHSNGFSLIRKVLSADSKRSLKRKYPGYGFEGKTLGEVLLTPTKIYVKPIRTLLSRVRVKSIAHITGGGIIENITRTLPEGVCAKINPFGVNACIESEVRDLFALIAQEGRIGMHEMYNVFNMGVGMVVAIAPEDFNLAIASLRGTGAFHLGNLAVRPANGPSVIFSNQQAEFHYE